MRNGLRLQVNILLRIPFLLQPFKKAARNFQNEQTTKFSFEYVRFKLFLWVINRFLLCRFFKYLLIVNSNVGARAAPPYLIGCSLSSQWLSIPGPGSKKSCSVWPRGVVPGSPQTDFFGLASLRDQPFQRRRTYVLLEPLGAESKKL
jgi:hypothetical protein